MRIYTRYKSKRGRRGPGSPWYWLLGLGCLTFLGWIWWRAARTPEILLQPAPPVPSATPSHPTPTVTVEVPAPTISQPFPLRSAPIATNILPPNALVLKTNLLMVTNLSRELRALKTPPGPFVPRPATDLFEAQIVLAREGISAGSLDGVAGSQTRAALMAFQRRERLPQSGILDTATRARLILSEPPLAIYTVTEDDASRLSPVSSTWEGKSEQQRLDYETILELVAEKAQSHPNLIRRLNPEVDWTRVAVGTRLRIPALSGPSGHSQAGFIRISLAHKTLEVFDSATNLLAHFPCSIARQVEKRPVGQLHVAVVARNPNYTFNPELFPESAEARELDRKLILPPGPNNPVGVAWIGLDRPGYGIHGTPNPEQVGRTESHGCFRLANWNADYLARVVTPGLAVYVEP